MKRSKMKLSNEAKFRLAVHTALLAGVSTAVMPVSAQEAAADEKATELEAVEVTGSRLGRADIEGALPIATITREDIDRSGFTSVGELLRNTTFNSLGAFRAQSGSSAQALVAVDLRGLGSERTLVLIDGRRAPKAPFAPSAQDLNAVPIAMVERIEVLKDGASAIYGSDAIAGVINIITRKDYQGTSVNYQKQGTDRIGGDSHGGQFVSGLTSDRGSMTFGASFFSRDIIFARNSLYNTPGASFFSNNYVLRNFVDANSDYIDDNTGNPYYGAIARGCPNSDPAFYLVPNLIGGQNCAYDFNLVAADEAATGNQSVFVKGNYKINDSWQMSAAGSVARATSFGRYAPSLNDFAIIVPATSVNNPFFNDGNPTNDQAIRLFHRFAALGTRDNDTDANVYDLSGLISGDIGDVNVTAGTRYNQYQYYELGKNYVVTPIAAAAITTGISVGGVNTIYDIYNPTVNNSAALLNRMKATITRDSIWDTLEYFAEAKMPVFDMGGGSAALAAGVEYRTEKYFDQYDSLQEGGAIGGSAGNSSGTNRRIGSVFGELFLPVMDKVEVSVSGRFEDYNDVGGNFAPKVSTRIQPVDSLTFRASYGQGFRAPSLDVISALPAFSADPIRNDAQTCAAVGGNFVNGRCSRSTQVSATVISNPNLEAEESDQFSVGVAVDVTDYIDVSLDFYAITLENTIDQLSSSDLVDLLNRGRPLPAGFSVTRAPTGRISTTVTGFGNQGTFDTNGLDLAANMGFALGGLGKVDTHLQATYIMKYELDRTGVTIDSLGEPGVPEYRVSLDNSWTLANMNLALNANHIAAQEEGVSAARRVPSFTTWDVQFGYEMPFLGGAQIAVGAINVFGREPSNNSQADGRDYNFALYDQYGTQPYVKFTQKF